MMKRTYPFFLFCCGMILFGLALGHSEATDEKASGPKDVRMSRSVEDLKETHNADGSVDVRLKGRFRSFSAIKIMEDGSKQMQCFDNESELQAFLDSGVSPRATLKRQAK